MGGASSLPGLISCSCLCVAAAAGGTALCCPACCRHSSAPHAGSRPAPACPPPAEPHLQHVAALVRDCMEGAAATALRVPLRVRLAAGPSWGQLQELSLPRPPN